MAAEISQGLRPNKFFWGGRLRCVKVFGVAVCLIDGRATCIGGNETCANASTRRTTIHVAMQTGSQGRLSPVFGEGDNAFGGRYSLKWRQSPADGGVDGGQVACISLPTRLRHHQRRRWYAGQRGPLRLSYANQLEMNLMSRVVSTAALAVCSRHTRFAVSTSSGVHLPTRSMLHDAPG
jgi:hypothetical protein